MARIFGFDLSEMSWSAFGSKQMFDRRWPLRRERIIIYKFAMLICLAAECTATYSLTKYEDLQGRIELASRTTFGGGHPAHVYQNDLIDAEIVTIVFCVLVATIFGTDFFFLLFFPRRIYPKWYNATKKALAVIITIGVFIAAVVSTVVVAGRSARIAGVTPDVAQALTSVYFRPPLKYNAYPTNIAYVVLLWLGFIATAASTAIMFIAVRHDERYGPDPSESMSEPKTREGLPSQDTRGIA